MGLKALAELLGGVLEVPIGMKYCLPFFVRAVAHRHVDGITEQSGAHMVAHRIPDCFLGAVAGDRGQVYEPLPSSHAG